MIKSNLGTVEVTGAKLDVMADLSHLFEVLRWELGAEDYNRILQNANNPKWFGGKPEDKGADFEPYLLLLSKIKRCGNYGRIGEETSIYDITGRKLSVGDVVNLYSIRSDGQLGFRGEKTIVKDNDSEFVMGIKGCKFDRGVSTDYFGWIIILNRRCTEVKDGEMVGHIKYIKSERTGK